KTAIRYSCKNNQSSAGGFTWKYEEKEQFKDIRPINMPNYSTVYATETGCIIMSSGRHNYGIPSPEYLKVALRNEMDGKYHQIPVHRLVALAFHGDYPHLVVNHKNGIKTDNRPDNLEYVTHQENVVHAISSGLIDQTKRHKSVIRICKETGNITALYES